MVYRDIIDARKTIKFNKYFSYFLQLLLFLICLFFLYYIHSYLLSNSDIEQLSLLIALFLGIVTMSLSYIQWLATDTKSIEYKLKEFEIQQIKDSMDMFYVPLLNLLVSYNENVTCKTKERIMIEVNSHKHLAELAKPSVLLLLEVYLKGNEESKLVSGELLKLVSRDIDNLQQRYIGLRNRK